MSANRQADSVRLQGLCWNLRAPANSAPHLRLRNTQIPDDNQPLMQSIRILPALDVFLVSLPTFSEEAKPAFSEPQPVNPLIVGFCSTRVT